MRTSIATGVLAILLSAGAAVGVFYLLDQGRGDGVSAADVSTDENDQQAPAAFDQEWAPEPEAYDALTRAWRRGLRRQLLRLPRRGRQRRRPLGADPVDARP